MMLKLVLCYYSFSDFVGGDMPSSISNSKINWDWVTSHSEKDLKDQLKQDEKGIVQSLLKNWPEKSSDQTFALACRVISHLRKPEDVEKWANAMYGENLWPDRFWQGADQNPLLHVAKGIAEAILPEDVEKKKVMIAALIEAVRNKNLLAATELLSHLSSIESNDINPKEIKEGSLTMLVAVHLPDPDLLAMVLKKDRSPHSQIIRELPEKYQSLAFFLAKNLDLLKFIVSKDQQPQPHNAETIHGIKVYDGPEANKLKAVIEVLDEIPVKKRSFFCTGIGLLFRQLSPKSVGEDDWNWQGLCNQVKDTFDSKNPEQWVVLCKFAEKYNNSLFYVSDRVKVLENLQPEIKELREIMSASKRMTPESKRGARG